ncbi:class I SAM-dependent methyltransferase [Asticcacaulis biprosthecium]|uniref:class I SAM-dependent methyltransferase n=1 Tax=Asticcacaulis biprosthecium TaxID=76891 RepID=UPI00058AE9AD|nr:class I SAM-dependent methyltransferase [Asticcacaulis biprosthecium]
MKLRTLIAGAWRAGRDIDLSHCHYGPVPVNSGYYGTMPYYRLLAGLVRLLAAETIVEIGTYHGGSTLAMVAGAKGATVQPKIITFDPTLHENAALDAVPFVTRVTGNFPDVSSVQKLTKLVGDRRIDLLYIDALKDQTFIENTLKAVEAFQPKVIVFDDIAANDNIASAWRNILESSGWDCISLNDVLEGVRNVSYDFGICVADETVFKSCAGALAELTGEAAFAGLALGEPYSFGIRDVFETVPSMMNNKELGLLYQLARRHVTGLGQVVDAGSLLGSSSLALGLGLKNGRVAETVRVHAYDRFVNSGPNYEKLLNPPVERTGSFLPQYIRNIAPVIDRVNIYAGDFAAQRWCGKPIELFFADIGKSVALNAHLYSEFAPYWIPGHTLYVQQDFVHLEAPWIQYVLGYLQSHFTVLKVEAPSLLMGVNSLISEEEVARIVNDDFTSDEKVNFVLSFARRFTDVETVATLRMIAARLMGEGGDLTGAEALLESIRSDAGKSPDKNIVRRLKRTQTLLAEMCP